MDILIFAIEAGRFGPARLPQNLQAMGLSVATLCPQDNVLGLSEHASHRFTLPRTRSAPRMARALADAIRQAKPRLIIPADEQAVVLMHGFACGNCARDLDADALATIVRSLGRPDRYGAMLFKSETLALARSIGVCVPDGGTANTAGEALHIAEAIGYPVFLKHSFGWSGQGVIRCDDAGAVLAALHQRTRLRRVKAMLRRVLNRDWYPALSPVDVQGVVKGRPAMVCALAWRGRMIGAFGGETLSTTSATGPSSSVRLGPHPAMEAAAKAMIEAMGCTGWVGFDFMLDEEGGEPVLLECNPRPIQVCHLGYRIGVDLAAELASLLRGEEPRRQPLRADRTLDVVLFPHALDPGRVLPGMLDDVPGADHGLMAYGRAMQRVSAAPAIGLAGKLRQLAT